MMVAILDEVSLVWAASLRSPCHFREIWLQIFRLAGLVGTSVQQNVTIQYEYRNARVKTSITYWSHESKSGGRNLSKLVNYVRHIHV
jgi:hypothetical protein